VREKNATLIDLTPQGGMTPQGGRCDRPDPVGGYGIQKSVLYSTRRF